jgi:hypothetical protein
MQGERQVTLLVFLFGQGQVAVYFSPGGRYLKGEHITMVDI